MRKPQAKRKKNTVEINEMETRRTMYGINQVVSPSRYISLTNTCKLTRKKDNLTQMNEIRIEKVQILTDLLQNVENHQGILKKIIFYNTKKSELRLIPAHTWPFKIHKENDYHR